MDDRNIRRFASSAELLEYLREHTDDIERVVIPVPEVLQIRGADGRRKEIVKGLGAILKLCDGRSLTIGREDAAMLINDGVLQRLKIRCALDTLKD